MEHISINTFFCDILASSEDSVLFWSSYYLSIFYELMMLSFLQGTYKKQKQLQNLLFQCATVCSQDHDVEMLIK